MKWNYWGYKNGKVDEKNRRFIEGFCDFILPSDLSKELDNTLRQISSDMQKKSVTDSVCYAGRISSSQKIFRHIVLPIRWPKADYNVYSNNSFKNFYEDISEAFVTELHKIDNTYIIQKEIDHIKNNVSEYQRLKGSKLFADICKELDAIRDTRWGPNNELTWGLDVSKIRNNNYNVFINNPNFSPGGLSCIAWEDGSRWYPRIYNESDGFCFYFQCDMSDGYESLTLCFTYDISRGEYRDLSDNELLALKVLLVETYPELLEMYFILRFTEKNGEVKEWYRSYKTAALSIVMDMRLNPDNLTREPKRTNGRQKEID